MPKSQPINIRLRPDLDERVTALARRTNRSKSAILESLIDEAERMRRYPGIRFSGDEGRRRAALMGSALDVWQVIEALKDWDNDVSRMARESDVSRHMIELSLAYYREFPQEIDGMIELDRRPIEQLAREYPFAVTLVVDDAGNVIRRLS